MLKKANLDTLFTVVRVICFWLCCMVIFASTNALMKSLREPWSLIASCSIAAILTFGLTVVFIRWQQLQLNEVGFVLNKRSFSRVLIGFMLGLLLPGLQAALVLLTG